MTMLECPHCDGTGLSDEYRRCSRCGGKGKEVGLPGVIVVGKAPVSLMTARRRVAGSERPFARLELDQGGDDWRAWRFSGIGSSDASVIMRENPWKTARALFEEKVREFDTFEGNARTRRGTQLEPFAREQYQRFRQINVPPAVVQSNDHEWQLASVDGLSACASVVVEIKCGESAYAQAERTRKVPKYYYGQLQHILSVTGLEEIDYFCYWPDRQSILVPVKRDNRYIAKLIGEEENFWKSVLEARVAGKSRRQAHSAVRSRIEIRQVAVVEPRATVEQMRPSRDYQQTLSYAKRKGLPWGWLIVALVVLKAVLVAVKTL